MAMFKIALINELEKLYKKKKALAAVIFSLAVIILGQLAIWGVRSSFGIRGAGGGEFPILVLAVVIKTVLPLFVVLAAIDSFSGEFSHNIIRVTLLRPVSRFKIFTSKVVAAAIFILLNLLSIFLFSTVVGLLFNYHSLTIRGLADSFLAYMVSLLPLLVLVLGVIFLAHLLKSGIAVFFAAVLLFLASELLALFLPQYASLFITSHLGWYNLWLANTFPLVAVLRKLLVMLGYGIIFFVGSFYLFERKEF
ncbi:MAG TPA: ABC transporter permease subunit [Firmicutes bacterium]|nr:ABC transporter permease subunit [Bacillota bacterium]